MLGKILTEVNEYYPDDMYEWQSIVQEKGFDKESGVKYILNVTKGDRELITKNYGKRLLASTWYRLDHDYEGWQIKGDFVLGQMIDSRGHFGDEYLVPVSNCEEFIRFV